MTKKKTQDRRKTSMRSCVGMKSWLERHPCERSILREGFGNASIFLATKQFRNGCEKHNLPHAPKSLYTRNYTRTPHNTDPTESNKRPEMLSNVPPAGYGPTKFGLSCHGSPPYQLAMLALVMPFTFIEDLLRRYFTTKPPQIASSPLLNPTRCAFFGPIKWLKPGPLLIYKRALIRTLSAH